MKEREEAFRPLLGFPSSINTNQSYSQSFIHLSLQFLCLHLRVTKLYLKKKNPHFSDSHLISQIGSLKNPSRSLVGFVFLREVSGE